jgi:hypothetical protein
MCAVTASFLPDLRTVRLQVVPGWVADTLGPVVREALPHEFDAILLCLDENGQSAYLHPDQAGALGGEAAVLETGMRQTLSQELTDLEVARTELDGQRVTIVSKDGSPFVTSVLVSLGGFIEGNAPHGVLVLAPTYSLIALHEITGRDSIELIPALAEMASTLQQSGAPCSAEVYYLYGQVFHRIAFSEDEHGELVPDFPTELRDVVWSL